MVYQKQRIPKICKYCGKDFVGKKTQFFCCKNHKELQKERRSRAKKRIFILLYKNDKSCELCGWNAHTDILHFHHKDNEEKEMNVAEMIKRKYSDDKVLEEIKKGVILCPNCHLWIHYQGIKLKDLNSTLHTQFALWCNGSTEDSCSSSPVRFRHERL